LVLQAKGLTRHFRIGGLRGQTLHAVDDLDMGIAEREIVALVGESGSGKSTVARLLAMVYRPTAGEILFRGEPVSGLRRRKDVLGYRGQVPMVFQDPFSSLNPAHTIGHALLRGLKLHRPDLDRAGREAEAGRVLEIVGLVPPDVIMAKFPHELSGGQRQRVGFAQALSYRPKLILADEPVSMLDVSIRIGLLNVMVHLREEEDLSLLYITHDIASARYVSDRVLVMYAGHLVEHGPTDDVLHHPVHPYTRLLLSAVPDPRAKMSITSADVGEPPRVVDPDDGCRFRWRCPLAVDICAHVTPRLADATPGHQAACHVTVGPGPATEATGTVATGTGATSTGATGTGATGTVATGTVATSTGATGNRATSTGAGN
jgi:peptide/nickel transport system ATP-binding protein